MRRSFFLTALFASLSVAESYGNSSFDYVIVGGGTAGLALANRLSSNFSVAVIEAGGFYQAVDNGTAQVPGLDILGAGMSPSDLVNTDWGFVTQPQEGADGRSLHYARGKCLGGSSARNYMIHQIGTRDSYQQWAEYVGDDGYAFDQFLPYFKKSMNWTAPSSLRTPNATTRYNESAFVPEGGPLQISYPDYAQPFSTWLDGPMSEVGIPLTDDFHSGKLDGAKFCEITINPTTNLRDSSQTSYLAAAASNPGLTVLTYSLAERIVFSNLTATGVIVNGTTISANKEVIISAGTFQSPQLLMLSGIGPREELTKHQIPVLLDLPGVGQNMADHIFFGPSYEVNLETYTPLSRVEAAISLFTFNQTGPLQSNNADYIAFERLPPSLLPQSTLTELLTLHPPHWPDIEYFAINGFFGNFSSSLSPPPGNKNYATILAGLVKPTSRGTVTLASSNPRDLPHINPNWLTSSTDQSVAIAAYKRIRALFASAAMRPVLAGPNGTDPEAFPGLSTSRTDQEILAVIRATLATIWHAVGTCRMGRRGDSMAVVDSEARVMGAKGLRVVDASAFALLPPGHPVSTVYALAEKIAGGILEEA